MEWEYRIFSPDCWGIYQGGEYRGCVQLRRELRVYDVMVRLDSGECLYLSEEPTPKEGILAFGEWVESGAASLELNSAGSVYAPDCPAADLPTFRRVGRIDLETDRVRSRSLDGELGMFETRAKALMAIAQDLKRKGEA